MFVIKTELNKRTAREVASVALQRTGLSMTMTFLVCCLLLLISYWSGIIEDSRFVITGVLGFAFGSILVYGLNFSGFVRLFNRQLQEKGNGELCPVETTISGANVTQSTLSNGNTLHVSLDELVQATETRHYFVIVFKNRMLLILDKAGITTGSKDELKKHIEGYCPGHKPPQE